MGYYYVQVDKESNKIIAKSDLSGTINRENTYRISQEEYEKDIIGKMYDIEKKEVIENE